MRTFLLILAVLMLAAPADAQVVFQAPAAAYVGAPAYVGSYVYPGATFTTGAVTAGTTFTTTPGFAVSAPGVGVSVGAPVYGVYPYTTYGAVYSPFVRGRTVIRSGVGVF